MLWDILHFILIVLASFGFAILMNTICNHLHYSFSRKRCVITVIPFSTEHNDLETAVSFFAKHTECGACHFVIILNDGLDESGIECAKILSEKYNNVILCNGNELYSTVKWLDSVILSSSESK